MELAAALIELERAAARVAPLLAAASPELLEQVAAAYAPAPPRKGPKGQTHYQRWRGFWLAWLADCGATWPSELPELEKPDEPDHDLHQLLIDWVCRG